MSTNARKRLLMIGAGGMAEAWIHRILPQFSDQLQVVGLVDVSQAALVARASMQLLAGTDLERVSRCEAPGCVLFFLKERRRRQWCSAACGNRAPVARHYVRHRSALKPPGE